MHLFPQLRKIERKYGDQVMVVGVHSPKFPAERETANLREAVLRYRIEHPVVNDRDFQVWQQYGGRAWPTLMFIDPQGRVIGRHEGELPFPAFDRLVGGLLAEFEQQGMLRAGPAPVSLEALREEEHRLRFPGKVLAGRDRLYIADTNHHRIVVARPDGTIERTIGAGLPGLLDGPAVKACFQQPQGLALDEENLYVADTENHAIRAVHLVSGAVSTLAGNGEQAPFPLLDRGGPSPMLSSPWDLALDGTTLYIAMAGTHQIWTLDLESGGVSWFGGTGREGLEDGPRLQAWFAQPSGLALMKGHLYVADSEVSAIREIDLATGEVTTLAGQGLFSFGDQDGAGETVRLQHPLGIAAHGGMLYIADSYNNKIKRLDPGTREVTTWLGGGEPGSADGAPTVARFREPGGLSASPAGLYIADTNNHRIAFADWLRGTVRTVIGA
ncbi:MAG TPA: alkyl hydroperoxide reductase [Candidatus Limnocylindrales bacterium]|nr:alkyl hydroperoxide reductase [Candidatus Limnocylindrales bacterium]